MREERQLQKMTEWASLFLEPGETIRVVTPGTFCDSAAGSPCAGCCDRDNRRRPGSPAHRPIDHPCPMREEEATNNPAGGTVGPGQVITLARRSAWPREYDMRSGERALGRLRWRPGRRCFAQAEGRRIGLIEPATRRRRAAAARAGSGETLAAADRGRGGSLIHVIEGRALRWEKTARTNHRAMRDQDRTLLVIAAAPGALRASQQHRSRGETGPGHGGEVGLRCAA